MVRTPRSGHSLGDNAPAVRELTAAEFTSWLAVPSDPPCRLFVWGEAPRAERRFVALVGSRRSSVAGLRDAHRIGCELAEHGMDVVSGLARGVDSAALEGSLAGGGRPAAILGNGLPEVYPPENADLARRIVDAGGMVATELPPGAPPRRSHFPRRNRLISALSEGVVVLAATRRSGSIITAKWALEQGKEVMALPGPAADTGYRGCHDLIREGATLVTDGTEILLALGGVIAAEGLALRGGRLERLARDSASPAELAERSGLPPAAALRAWWKARRMAGSHLPGPSSERGLS